MLRPLIAAVAIIATLTIATPAQAAQAKPAPVITIHAGDTLIKLAARHCGSASAYKALAAGNGISNPSRIYAGRKLKLTCARTTVVTRTVAKTPAASSRIRTVVNHAMAQIGKPYRWAAAGPNAYDCSGLVVASYARIGIRLPHQTGALISRGVRVSRAQLRIGDLVFLSSHHVALYIGGGKVVVAPHSGAYVRVEKIPSYIYAARRILA